MHFHSPLSRSPPPPDPAIHHKEYDTNTKHSADSTIVMLSGNATPKTRDGKNRT